jgi:thioredoxin-dependent peroxiredoxin
MSVKVGDPAPNFKLPTDGGKTLSMEELKGKNVVLYFYPKDDTPGCTREACSFRDNLPKFSSKDATILGVSRDSSESHDQFKAKYELPFTLVSDVDGKLSEGYGVWIERERDGKKSMGMNRSTFLIDKKGVIRKEWRGVNVDGHSEEVLAAINAL